MLGPIGTARRTEAVLRLLGDVQDFILTAQNNVDDVRMEYLILDRSSWLRVLGFELGANL